MTTPARVFFVGTDTGVGKTSLVCELLARAAALDVRVLPYKPAQSGEPLAVSDADRLLTAAPIPELSREHVVCFDFARPIAPGMADRPQSFLDESLSDTAPLTHCRDHLAAAIEAVAPGLVLIEGAGGLWVPMPGGTWQPEWIAALATSVVIVARAGLGTINHTLCTVDALRALGIEPVGFYLCEIDPPDPAVATNARVIATARAIDHLGTLPHHAAPTTCLLTPLLTRVPARP